jgi:hypothetical protein
VDTADRLDLSDQRRAGQHIAEQAVVAVHHRWRPRTQLPS